MPSLTKGEKEVVKEAIESRVDHLKAVIPYLLPVPAKRDKIKVKSLISVKRKLRLK